MAQDKIIVIMMEENNDIFLASGDALVYFAVPMHKKYSTAFVWGHSFSSYVSQDRYFNPPVPCKHMYAFRVTVSAVTLFQKTPLNTITHICIEQYDANATGE